MAELPSRAKACSRHSLILHHSKRQLNTARSTVRSRLTHPPPATTPPVPRSSFPYSCRCLLLLCFSVVLRLSTAVCTPHSNHHHPSMPPRTPGPFPNNNNTSCLPTSLPPPAPTSGNIVTPDPSMHRASPPPPPAALQTHTPPSNSDPDLGLDPSPVYSPLSTPAQTPKPPPSPPMAPVDAPRAPPPIVQDVKPSLLDTIKSAPIPSAPTSTTTPPPSSSYSPSSPSSTNTDSIALRSTLRLLMLQRERAKKDIQTLEELRIQAMDKPVEFIDYIQQLARGSPSNDYGATSGSSDEEGASTNTKKKKKNYAPFTTTKELPKPQEIFRCPQIEWQKYHVLGAPLDKLVEEQQRRPQVVPQQMQTGGVLGVGVEFGDKISGDGGGIQGRMRLFDGVAQRGGVVGR